MSKKRFDFRREFQLVGRAIADAKRHTKKIALLEIAKVRMNDQPERALFLGSRQRAVENALNPQLVIGGFQRIHVAGPQRGSANEKKGETEDERPSKTN